MAEMSPIEKFFVNSIFDYLFHKFFGARRFLKQIKSHDFETILEVGCGIGITTEFIASRFPHSKITATDFDKSQMKRAQRRVKSHNLIFQREDATRLSFSDNAFEACFAILVFHHIPLFSQALKEIHRVLQPNGKLYVMDIPVKSLNPFHKWITFGQPGAFTKKELIQYLSNTGFEIERAKGNLFFTVEARKP